MEKINNNVAKNINDYYTKYFCSMLKAFPQLLHLHFGILFNDKFNLLSIKDKIIRGTNLLLDEIIKFAGFNIEDRPLYGLDLGCGLGGTSIYLANKLHFTMLGITITESQIPIAMKNIKKYKVEDKVKIKYGDGTNLNFGNEIFDFVIMIEVAMHIKEKEKLFNEIYRVLKTGGKLIMADVEVSNYKPLMSCFGVHYFPIVNYYKNIGEHIGFKNYKENDVTKQINSWMKYYIIASGMIFQCMILISLCFKLQFISAYYFIKSNIFMKKYLKHNLKKLGFNKKEIKKYNSIKKVRSEFNNFLKDGSIIYKFIVQQK